MKPLCLLAAALLPGFAVESVAQTTVPHGFIEILSKDLKVEGYDFEFIRAEADKNHWRMGHFKFRWKGDGPVKLWGFGFQEDGSFRTRFEKFSRINPGSDWKEFPVGYCGTGAEMYELQPQKDYVLRIPLWPYQKEGSEGVVMLTGENIAVMSRPFSVEAVRAKGG